MKFWPLLLSLALTLGAANASAARLGGGKSVGKQSSNVTQREAVRPAPTTPTQNAAAAPTAAPAPMPQAPAPRRPWGAMLGGLAAGLGLAWLASSMGLGAGMGEILLIALLGLGAVMLVGALLRRRAAPAASPYAFAGAGGGAAPAVATPRTYRPENVGNDASARPWEQAAPEAAGGSLIGSALAGSQGWGIPAGFDTEGFLKSAKANFITLQAAWDKADLATLRAMMTDDMHKEIGQQLSDRAAQAGAAANVTDVVMIDAKLLGIEEQASEYLASVEFSGMLREDPSAGPNPFREVWNMSKPKDGSSGWLVAGVQALQ